MLKEGWKPTAYSINIKVMYVLVVDPCPAQISGRPALFAFVRENSFLMLHLLLLRVSFGSLLAEKDARRTNLYSRQSFRFLVSYLWS